MDVEIRMPKLGLTMESGAVTRWLKQQGDPVREGTLVDAGGPRDERPGREPQIMDPDVVPASRLQSSATLYICCFPENL